MGKVNGVTRTVGRDADAVHNGEDNWPIKMQFIHKLIIPYILYMLVAGGEFMQICSLGQESVFGLFGSEEEDARVVFDDFCGSVSSALVGITTMGTFEVDFTAEESATDDELVSADIGVEGDGAGAVSTSVDSTTGNNPGVEVGDGLVDVDITISDEDDLRSGVLSEDMSVIELDVGADSEITAAIDDERSGGEEAIWIEAYRSEVGGGEGALLEEDGARVAVNIASFEFSESGRLGDDFGITEGGNGAAVGAGTLRIGDSEVVGTAEEIASASEALSDRSGGGHFGNVAIGDDGEVSPGAIGEVGAVGLAGGGDGGLNTTISLDATAPNVDRGELGDVATGGAGDEVARVGKTIVRVSAGV